MIDFSLFSVQFVCVRFITNAFLFFLVLVAVGTKRAFRNHGG